MRSSYLDYISEELENLQADPGLTLPMQDLIQCFQIELNFLKMVYWCFSSGDRMKLRSVSCRFGDALWRIRFAHDTDSALSEFQETVDLSKSLARGQCVAVLRSRCSYRARFYATDDLVERLDSVLHNLHLINSKVNIVFRVKQQVKALEEKMRFFRDLAEFAEKSSIPLEKLAVLFSRIQAWARIVARLSFLYWVDYIDEETHHVNEFETYFRVPKGSVYSRSDTLLMGRLVASYVDCFLEELAVPFGDNIEIIREGLHFLITFLLDPPEDHSEDGKLIVTPTDLAVSEATSVMCSLYVLKTKEEITKERDILLSSFMKKVHTLKSEVRRFYVHVPKIFQSNFPMTNAIGFIESLSVNLNEMLKCKADFIPFAKHQVVTIQGQLESLQMFLKDIMELQNEHKNIKDLWTQIVNVAYQVEHVIDSCFLLGDCPNWYNVIRLSDIIEEIKLIKLEIKKITPQEMCSIRNATKKTDMIRMLPAPANTSKINQVVVAFNEVAESIIERLTRGTAQLDIVPIVGMPGQGKTTLAKKVYNDSSILYHFHKCAWSCVSQAYQRNRLLLDILCGIGDVDPEAHGQSEQDLAERLWKSLKGQRYLIVMDDIWDIKAWHELKEAFPDDRNGSRIMLTSRIHNLALQVKPDSSPLHLRPLSKEESWELLKERLNMKHDWSSDLLEVGEQIIKFCKGLPLAIVVLAGLLPRMTGDMVDRWNQIAENLGEELASEGCMDLLALSYKHLPEHLKPCFIYFGAFPEDRVIAVKKLTKLWIAEGFIKLASHKSLEDAALEYLTDLVNRSLVMVAKISSKGGIKACHVHDLFRDLCLAIAKDEHFLQQVHGYEGYDVSRFSLNPIKYDNYRLCICTDWKSFIESEPTGPGVHSLLMFSQGRWDFFRADIPSSFVYNFRHLKVLKLEIRFGRFFPKEIEALALLRHLDIRGDFGTVPSSIVNLQNLETFVVKSESTIGLPHTILMMKNLRHVYVKPYASFDINYHESSAPLSNIETLSTACIGEADYTMELFKRLSRLRKVSCDFWLKPLQFKRFNCLSKLESLKLVRATESKDQDRFQKSMFPITLRKLTLVGLILPESAISILGRLPNLEVLKLRRVQIAGENLDMEDEQLLNLKFLELSDVNIVKWNISSETFPCLDWLVLRSCYSLEGIPSCFGDISTLKMIEVHCCSQKTASSAREILNQQRDLGNEELQVHIS